MRQFPLLEVEYVPIESVTPYEGNAKEHDEAQVSRIMRSIERFGDCDPLGVWTGDDGNNYVVEGHGRLMALGRLGYDKVPVIFLNYLSDEQRRAYGLVHNQLTMNSGFDLEALADELEAISDINMEEFGFADFNEFEREEIGEEDDSERAASSGLVTCPCCGGKFAIEEQEQ